MGKLLAIAPVHGRATELMRLFQDISKKYKLSSFDRIIFLGDYLMYGEENIKTIQLLKFLQSKNDNLVFLKGNWEHTLFQLQCNKDKQVKDMYYKKIKDGNMEGALFELRENKHLFSWYIQQVKDMPFYHLEDGYVFSHSGIDYEEYTKKKNEMDYLTNLNEAEFLYQTKFHMQEFEKQQHRIFGTNDPYADFGYKVVSGQVPIDRALGYDHNTKFNAPLTIGNSFLMNFGAAYHIGRLGAVVFDESSTETFTVDVTGPEEGKREKRSREITYDLYRSGKTVAQIADERRVSERTIYDQFLQLYEEGYSLVLDGSISKDRENSIIQAMHQTKSNRAKVIKDHLPEGFGYEEIKLVVSKKKIKI